jgi:hypothetical protein
MYGAADALPPTLSARYGVQNTKSREAMIMARVVLLGTLDTKGTEYAFLRDVLAGAGVDVTVVHAGVFAASGI